MHPSTCLSMGVVPAIPSMPAVSEQCLFRIDSLDELPSLVAKHNAASG